MKKIGYLGAGAWGFSLANMLANRGHKVTSWSLDEAIVRSLQEKKEHPRFPGIAVSDNLTVTMVAEEALEGAEMIVESVTTMGLRPVLKQYAAAIRKKVPFVLTSKGIEQKTGLLLHQIAEEELGAEYRDWIGCVSGPSLADEVMRKVPTTVVCSAYNPEVMREIQEAFTTDFFRVYPNSDISGVEFGGAMKNSIAIACGLSDGLGFGGNTKAAIMTRGLHEMRKLAEASGCQAETLNGLAGMGDLCVTCLSVLSRNYRFGYLIAEGLTPEKAKEKIGMVVEGANTCVSAFELSHKLNVPLPISETVYKIIYKGLDPQQAVQQLLGREVKEEHL